MNNGKRMEKLCLEEFKELRGEPVLREWSAPTVKFQNSDWLGDWDICILYDMPHEVLSTGMFPLRRLVLIQVKSSFRRNLYDELKNLYAGFIGSECFYALYGRKPPKGLEYIRTPNFYLIRI